MTIPDGWFTCAVCGSAIEPGCVWWYSYIPKDYWPQMAMCGPCWVGWDAHRRAFDTWMGETDG